MKAETMTLEWQESGRKPNDKNGEYLLKVRTTFPEGEKIEEYAVAVWTKEGFVDKGYMPVETAGTEILKWAKLP